MQNKEKYRSLLSSLKKGPKSQRNFPPPAFYILQTLKKLMTKLSRRSHLVSRIVLRSLLNHTWKDALNQVNQVYLLTIQGLLLKIALLFKYLCREFRVRAPSSQSCAGGKPLLQLLLERKQVYTNMHTPPNIKKMLLLFSGLAAHDKIDGSSPIWPFYIDWHFMHSFFGNL